MIALEEKQKIRKIYKTVRFESSICFFQTPLHFIKEMLYYEKKRKRERAR